MTPQSSFMVVAPVADGKLAELRALLASMNLAPGVVNPDNDLVPFGQLDRLHVARFVVLEAPTAGDIAVYGMAPTPWPPSLVFLGDIDGDPDSFLRDLVSRADAGLRKIFALCEGFKPDGDLLYWMRRRERPSSANYVNWIGRTVRQVHEEKALHAALLQELYGGAEPVPDALPSAVRNRLARFVDTERQAGRLTLTPPEPTPTDWRLRNIINLIGVPIVLLALAPFLIVASPILAYMLRSREKSDPDTAPLPAVEHVRRTANLEDQEIANQFTVFGDLKPGLFRRWVTVFLLWVLDYSARHIYNRGYLTRVQTIHFARWVFLDDRKRLFFASNYDGSVESYMDDFINKVAWGINLVFSNGVGYPRSNWLVLDGARNEQKYKRVLRRHQLPTDVWYKAYPGLTVVDLERNSRIRAGIERSTMTDEEAREWLRLL
jgi:hypothetical protein